jgi:hypothetical protein
VTLTDEPCFARVLAVLAGERFAFDESASKVMYFMLRDDRGCDAVISARGFEINFGWSYGPHHYVLSTAPPIVSWLLDAAGARGAREVRVAIGPTDLPSVKPCFSWRAPALHVAMVAGLDQVSIRVRDRVAALADPLPAPAPAPHAPGLAEATQPCRHCGQVPDSYRVLRDRSFVCLACGRSQPALP